MHKRTVVAVIESMHSAKLILPFVSNLANFSAPTMLPIALFLVLGAIRWPKPTNLERNKSDMVENINQPKPNKKGEPPFWTLATFEQVRTMKRKKVKNNDQDRNGMIGNLERLDRQAACAFMFLARRTHATEWWMAMNSLARMITTFNTTYPATGMSQANGSFSKSITRSVAQPLGQFVWSIWEHY